MIQVQTQIQTLVRFRFIRFRLPTETGNHSKKCMSHVLSRFIFFIIFYYLLQCHCSELYLRRMKLLLVQTEHFLRLPIKGTVHFTVNHLQQTTTNLSQTCTKKYFFYHMIYIFSVE